MEEHEQTGLSSKLENKKQPFTEQGQCLDEVTFEFEDGQKLYVSQNFLNYVSPVFTAMFQHEWREKETRIVALKGKDYQSFLDFLLCLHPNEQKPFNYDNVLQIVHLADEYQADLIIKRCKQTMLEWLQSELKNAKLNCNNIQKLQRARTCLTILTAAQSLNYEETVEHACDVLSKFGHTIFTGKMEKYEAYPTAYPGFTRISTSTKPDGEDPLADCRSLFDELPQHLKHELILKRLRLKDDTNMK